MRLTQRQTPWSQDTKTFYKDNYHSPYFTFSETMMTLYIHHALKTIRECSYHSLDSYQTRAELLCEALAAILCVYHVDNILLYTLYISWFVSMEGDSFHN